MRGVETAVGRGTVRGRNGTPGPCTGRRAGEAVRLLRRVILLALACVALVGMTGCGDGTGTTVVTEKADLDSGPRGLEFDLVNPHWSVVYTSGETAVAIGAEGSICRSADGGKTWEAVSSGSNDDLRALNAEGPRLVAVGDHGAIVRSEDGGKTWAAVPSGTVWALRAVHGEGQRLVAVGESGAILRSEDGGKTWAVVPSGTDRPLIAVYGEGQRLVAVGESGAIVRSEDGGRTWAAVPNDTERTLYALHGEGQRLVAVGEYGAIVRSEDGGRTWAAVPSDTEHALYALHGEGQLLVAVGIGAIVRSQDGGKTWAEVPSGTYWSLTAVHGEGQRLVAVGISGAILRSEDGGKTWAEVPSGTYWSLTAVHGEGQRLVAVGISGAIVRSEDGGKTWAEVSRDTVPDLRAVHGEGPRLVAVGESGAIVRSEDGGKTWATVPSGTDRTLIAVHGEGQRLVAVGESGGDSGAIVRSEDGGKTWAAVPSGTYQSLTAVHGEGQRLVAVGGSGAIVRSEDGGKTWATVPSGINENLRAIHGEGQRLVAVGESGAIVRSEDGGKTWVAAQSGTDQFLGALHGEGQRLVAVGYSGAIVRSEDGGKTWAAVPSGTDQNLGALHGESQRLVAVGESGAIIVRSEDGGKTWAAVPSGTDRTLIAVHGDGPRLVTVGRSGVIMRSEDGGKTWTRVRRGIPSYDAGGRKLLALYGDRQRLVAVGKEIVVLTATGPRFPLLDRIDYAPTLNPGELELRFQIRDPDKQCAVDCQMRVLGANKTDVDHRRPFDALAGQPRRLPGTDTWVTTLNPEAELKVHPGEDLYLDATLSGPAFSLRYPLGEDPIRVGYLIDYTYYYVGLALLSVAAGLLLVFWLRPLWILLLYRRAGLFELAGKIPVPGVADAAQVLGNLLVLPWLARQPRVLDAWLARHREAWETEFRCVKAVERLRYYPLPLRRPASDERIKSPAPMHFKGDFAARRTLMQILGPGGSGKTSVAAQLGKWSLDGALGPHPMLPIWLDEDIADLGAWLLEKVRAVAADEDLPETFIQALFRRKRLWVIADRLSEKQAATQKALCHPPTYLNALVVTSRTAQDFRRPDVSVIEAVPLSSENLMGFLNDLLESRGDDEAFRGFGSQVDLARRLADVISIGQQEIPVTPLLVSLFVKRALDQAKDASVEDLDRLPRSVPDVYFDYLRSVNPGDPSAANYCPNEVMIEAANLIAKVELGDDFRPKRIPKTVLLEALRGAGLSGSCDPLRRLLDNQVLEQWDIGGTTRVAFALDPIAEYVAAFALAEDCGTDKKRWQALRTRVTKRGEGAAGFAEALRVTHEVYAKKLGWP